MSLDGAFPNHPADPIQPENLIALRERILATGADVGLAFDGDADRCFLVDDQGVPVSGSTTTSLVAASILGRRPGATVLHNLICSKAVPEIIREHRGIPVRTRVGHSYIKAIMADTDAVFGGERTPATTTSGTTTGPTPVASPPSSCWRFSRRRAVPCPHYAPTTSATQIRGRSTSWWTTPVK